METQGRLSHGFGRSEQIKMPRVSAGRVGSKSVLGKMYRRKALRVPRALVAKGFGTRIRTVECVL